MNDDELLASLSRDLSHTQCVCAVVVAACRAEHTYMDYDQQVTVAFSHFAGYAHPGSAREITYQIRETLIVLGALAPLICGQPLYLT